jgi:hypothetical protein
LQINGIDLEGLAHEASAIDIPPVVKGRTVHIDADFLAYQVTAEKADGTDEKTYEDMQHNAKVAVDTLRDLAGAEHVHLHLTPSTSNKGGRYLHAIQKPYQGNREDKPKPRYLGIMREWLAKRYQGTLHQFCEADDGMSSAQYQAIARGESNLSIIASKDKDLCMVPGLHLDWDTGLITNCADAFGNVQLIERTSSSGTKTKKLKGYGQKFFWAQMLIGDTADNIQGLPAVPSHVMNIIKPTAAIDKAKEILKSPNSNAAQKAKAQAVLDERKPAACGPATAIIILDMMHDHKTAFDTIKNMYRSHGEKIGFTHHATGEPAHWGHVFASEAKLLWMRRDSANENCVLDWMKELKAA